MELQYNFVLGEEGGEYVDKGKRDKIEECVEKVCVSTILLLMVGFNLASQ